MKPFRVLAASILAAAAVLLPFGVFEYFGQLNSNAYDFTLRLAGPIQPSSPALIVAIDEDSLSRLGKWPWSRDTLARLIEHVEQGSPSAIAVDILLDDLTSEGNNALAAAIGKSKAVVLPARIDAVEGIETWRKPRSEFLLPVVRLGHVHADPDVDGISRRFYSAKECAGTIISALALESLRSAGIPIDSNFEEVRPGGTLIRPQTVNIRFVGEPGTFPRVSAWKVLENKLPPDALRGRIALIGFAAEGVDQWPFTPFAKSGRRMSGVEIHANAIETLYTHRWIREVPEVVLFFAVAGILALLW